MLCNRISGPEEFQAEYIGAARAGCSGGRANGHVGGRGGVRARRARLEPCARARQFYTHFFSNNKVCITLEKQNEWTGILDSYLVHSYLLIKLVLT